MPHRNSRFLTEPTIERMRKPRKGGRVEVFDSGAPGLVLRITDKGARSWSVYFRFPNEAGRSVNSRMTLGTYPAMGVSEARKLAQEARMQAAAGIDPRAAKAMEIKARAKQAVATERSLFRNIAEKYIEARCQQDKDGAPKHGHLRRGREIDAIIRHHLIPAWGDRLITEIGRHDLRDVTRPVVTADKPGAAHRLHKTGKTLFNWAVDEGFLDASPFARMKAPVQNHPRERDLKHPELKRLWAACEVKSYPFGPLVQLLALTLQRRNEVAEMQWHEIDLDKALWTLPAERSKSERAHIIPLSKPAVKIIKGLPRYLGGPNVFTTTEGARPVSGFSRMKAQLDTVAKISAWRLHDLRRTGRSEMARLNVDDVVAERVLNHLPRGLARVYNRYEYLPEKRSALELWARELRKITKPSTGEVVRLRKRA